MSLSSLKSAGYETRGILEFPLLPYIIALVMTALAKSVD